MNTPDNHPANVGMKGAQNSLEMIPHPVREDMSDRCHRSLSSSNCSHQILVLSYLNQGKNLQVISWNVEVTFISNQIKKYNILT